MTTPRLDWRFLLADSQLDRVGYVGVRDEGVLAELESVCRSVRMVDANEARRGQVGESEACDVVLAHRPTVSELRTAAEWTKLGGTLVVECYGPAAALTVARWWMGRAIKTRVDARAPRRRSKLDSPGVIVLRLQRLGFEDLRAYWHWPDFERCTQIIPLDEAEAVRFAFSRASWGLGTRIKAWLGRWLHSRGLLGWAAQCVSVKGRRVRADESGRTSQKMHVVRGQQDGARRSGASPSVVHTFLYENWSRFDLDRRFPSRRVSSLVLTPRFRNSSHLVFLLLPQNAEEPVLVAKLPRLSGRCARMDHEAEHLRHIQEIRPRGFDSIPCLVTFEPHGDRMLLLETALHGRTMDRVTVRKAAQRCCQATLAWLLDVHTGTRLTALAADEFNRLIGRELSDLGVTFPTETHTLEGTRRLVAPLSDAGIPSVLEHRDLSHPNLLIDPQGRVGAVDWEQAELRGLPASDLFFFLTYVAIALKKARSNRDVLAALDWAFFGRRSWARTYVRQYAQELDLATDVLTPLFVAGWARQVAGLCRRAAKTAEDATGPDPELRGWLSRNWRFAAWQHSVQQADRLDWTDLP